MVRRRRPLLAALGLVAYACGPAAKEGAVPHGAGARGALTKAPDVPPPAAAPQPIAYKPFTFAVDLTVRRPLVPMPSPIPQPTAGSVDASDDETPLQDVLIGAAATGADKDKPIDADIGGVKSGVRLVIDSPYQIFSKAGTYIHVAAWLPSFAPAANARVFVDGKLRGRTNADGTFVFRAVPEEKSYGGFSNQVVVVAGAGQARVQGGATYRAGGRTQGFERANLYVYTDRGVFSPGETVHVRAFAWRLRGDYRPFADAPVNVMLRKDGKLLGGARVKTDEMGVAWVDLPLPGTAPEGPYELAVEHLGERATARLQVKRIVAPAVRIDHDLPRFLTRDANELAFEVKLATSNGEPFKSGKVVVKGLDPNGAVVATESRAVTGSGPHAFSLGADALKKMRDAFPDDKLAAVIVEVVDGATGRRDELRRDLRISKTPWRLVIETDRNEHVPGETVKVVVHATDLEQAPSPGMDVELTYNGQDGQKTIVAKTDENGLAKTDLTMPQGSLSLTARLVKAKSVTANAYVSSSPPRAMFADVPLALVKEKADTPVEIRFPSGYVPAEKVVHADVVDSSGGLIHAFLVPISKDGGAWVARGSFPAPSWGSMLITFFALGFDKSKPGDAKSIGLLTDGANLPVVAARPITVTLKAPGSAAPGAPIAIDVALEGPKGKGPRPIAIGAAIADDSMLALLDPLERTPSQVLYNPERKVMASTGSQILTWPVVQKTWGAPTYDIALPPFGFRAGGSAAASPLGKKPVGKPKPSKAKDYGSGGGIGLGKIGAGGGGGSAGYGTGSGYGAGAASGQDYDAPEEAAMEPPPPPAAPAPAATASAKQPAMLKAEAGADGIAHDKKDASGQAPTPKQGPVSITIRTDFSPTSLWLPERIVAAPKNGEPATTKIDAKLPDTIGTQRVTVVATDDRGAIGIGKATIKVDQDVSVRSDLPASLVQGDEVEVAIAVRNTRPEPITGTVSFGSHAIQVVGNASSPITVPASSTGAIKLRVRADHAGSTPFTVSFAETRAPGATSKWPLRNDSEERTLWVAPKGVPVESRVDATLSAAKVASFEIERDAGDAFVEADLSVAFPSAVPLIEGLDDLVDDDAYVGVDPDASRLLAAIAIEGYLVRTKAKPAVIARVHARLQLAATSLLLQQQSDGGFGWRWDTWAALHGLGTGSSPYVTTHALTALAKLRDTNVPVPDAAIAAARTYLIRSLDQNGEVDVSNVAFWEGDGASKRRAATMAAFQAIALTEKTQPLNALEKKKVEALASKAREIVKGGEGSEDPLTLSSAVMGLWLHARALPGGPSTVREDVDRGIKLLLASYRGGYWEPSWFHAWGGRIEATRGVIELLSTVAPGAFDADLHDAVDYLLATRPSWGAWHNAWGTAAAIEALTFLDPTPPEKTGATVTVSVDGKPVRTVKIDPDDPFVSAASLRSVDLSPHLEVGKHTVTLAYDGSLTAPASVTLKRWLSGTARIEAPDLKVERALSSTDLTLGATTTATVTLTSKTTRPEVIVSMPLAAGVTADRAALEAMVKDGTLASFRNGASLVMLVRDVSAGSAKSLKIPLVADRKGTFALAAMKAVVPRAGASAWSGDVRLAVK